jgi:hypothetical protein
MFIRVVGVLAVWLYYALFPCYTLTVWSRHLTFVPKTLISQHIRDHKTVPSTFNNYSQ